MGTRGGDEAVLQSLLHGGTNGLVEGDEVLRGGHVFGREVVEIGADAERALHCNQEAELEWRLAIWRVGDPGHHYAGSVGVGESVLDGEAVERVGVVGGPDLLGAAHDAEIDAAAAAGAGFDLELGMLRAQAIEDGIEILNVGDVNLFLVSDGHGVPTGLRPVAVVVPLEKIDVVVRDQLVEPVIDVLHHVGTGEVQQKLIAAFRARAAGEVHGPLGMLAVEIAVGVDHLRLDPDAEVHAELVDAIDDRFEAVGELLFVDVPVAESGVIVLALAEPAVVDDEALDAELRSLFGERDLTGFADVELGGFPRVVEDRAEFGMRRAGEDDALLEAVEDA